MDLSMSLHVPTTGQTHLTTLTMMGSKWPNSVQIGPWMLQYELKEFATNDQKSLA